MTGNLIRRLDRLEASARPRRNLAVVLEHARRRLHGMTDAQRHAAAVDRLDTMRRRHADQPLRGLSLAILRGLERASSHNLTKGA